MNISLYQIIFAVVPESLLLVCVSLGLVKIKSRPKNYLKMGSIYTICFWLVRTKFNVYRIHSLILCLILSFIFKLFLDLEYNLAVIASLLGMVVLILGDVLVGAILINYSGVEMINYGSQGELSFFIWFYLMKIPLIVLSGLIYFFNFNIRE